jgi:signal transduction histidine kinase
MTEPTPQANPVDAEGLLGIVECEIPSGGAPIALSELCRALGEAVGADVVGLVVGSVDTPEIRGHWSRAAVGPARVAEHAAAALAAAGDAMATARPGVLIAALPGEGALVAVGVAGDPAAPGVQLALRIAADRAGAALALARARADLDHTLARILESDERLVGRIGLDIHDGPTQHLSVGLLEVQLLQAQLGDAVATGVALPEGLEASVERIYETLGGALTEMRELIGYLRPVRFQGRRLNEILDDVVTTFEARSGIEVQYETDGEFVVDGVSVTQRITFYRVLQEALSNAQRHGQATAVLVELGEDETGTRLTVVDNGTGFNPVAFTQPVLGSSIARYGLHGMRDRTTMLGGTFEMISAPGEGCTLRVFLPRWSPPDAADDTEA